MNTYNLNCKDVSGNYHLVTITAPNLRSALTQLRETYPQYVLGGRA